MDPRTRPYLPLTTSSAGQIELIRLQLPVRELCTEDSQDSVFAAHWANPGSRQEPALIDQEMYVAGALVLFLEVRHLQSNISTFRTLW